MKKVLGVALVAVLVLGISGAAMAWWGPGWGWATVRRDVALVGVLE